MQRDRLWLRLTQAVVAIALFVPQTNSFEDPYEGARWMWPRVTSGDEPHYLVLLNSLVADGDLDVANNYQNVHEGGNDAGENFRNGRLHHHTAWIGPNGRLVLWTDVYFLDLWKWPPNAAGHKMPFLREGVDPAYTPTKEYSYQWPGVAFLLTPFLFPFAGTQWVEPLAIFSLWIASVLSLLAFTSIARTLQVPTRATCVALVLLFLGTPMWHYARALFSEPFAIAALLWAYALFAARKHLWLAGILCGMAMLMKATFVVMIAPLGLALLWDRKVKPVALFAAPLVVSLAISLWLNHHMFGKWLQGPQPWLPGDLWHGAKGLLIDQEHGLLLYSPVVLCGALGWPALWREQRRLALVALGGIAGLSALTASYALWTGGYCYGPRLLLPIIPLILLGLLMRCRKLSWRCADLVLVGGFSAFINAHGAVYYFRYWAIHPFASWFT